MIEVFVPPEKLRQLRELAYAREMDLWRERGWLANQSWLDGNPGILERVHTEALRGDFDHRVEDELREHEPPEWEQLRRLAERAAVQRWRQDGESAVQIDLRLLMDAGRVDRLVTPAELAEILAAHSTIAAHPGVRAALEELNQTKED